MSASIDEDPAGGEDARGVLAGWLDDYAAGRCDREDMQASFLSVCRTNADAPWDALALLDQYQRRRRIDVELVRTLKAEIAQLVFGVANQTEAPRDPMVATLDTTGSRWRKLLEQTDPETLDTEPAFADPGVFRRDFDPATRPPAGASPAEAPKPVRRESDVLRERYELLSILGRGRSGTVYKTLDRHRSHLPPGSRCVAVKVLKLDYQDRPEALAELERDVHQAQSLSHPHIATVFDLDRDGDVYFIVMELLEGALLSDVLRRLDGRPMQREHALAVIGSVGAALAYAHRRDVVHADLKPANVMVTTEGEVRVLDFGFARHRALHLHSASALHAPVAPVPAYASVERVNGSAPHPSDDVYSLACIAYELLSGRHPFGGHSAVLARAHGRRPRRIAGLSRKQAQALNRALFWTRGERKIGVTELLAALGCGEAPSRPAPPELLAIPSVRSPWRRRVIAMGAFIALAVAGAAALYTRPDVLPSFAWRETVEQPAPEPANARVPADTAAAVPNDAEVGEAGPEQVAAAPEEASEVASPVERAPVREAVASGPVRIELDKDSYVANESDGSVRVVVRRRGSLRGTAAFRWSLTGNSAEQGADFAGIGPGIERFADGAAQATLLIPLVSDALAEATEVFLVEIEPAQANVTLGERAYATVIIVDDD